MGYAIMTTATAGQPHASSDSRASAGISALVLSLACGGALALFSAEIAVNGGSLERVAVPARMLGLVLLATVLLKLSGDTWHAVGLNRPRSIWKMASLVLGGYLAIAVVAMLGHTILPALGLVPKMSAMFAALKGDTAEYLYWLLPVAWGSAAFGEELVFRGFLQSRLERFIGGETLSAWLSAAVLQALIFGLLHSYLGAAGAIMAAATGLVLGFVYVISGRNLWACIILHGLVDTVSLTALYLGAMPAN